MPAPPSGPGARAPPIRIGASERRPPGRRARRRRTRRRPRRRPRPARSARRAGRDRRPPPPASTRAEPRPLGASRLERCACRAASSDSVYTSTGPRLAEEPRRGRRAQTAVEHHPQVRSAGEPQPAVEPRIVGEHRADCRPGSRRAPRAARARAAPAAAPEIQRLSPPAVAILPSRLIAHLRVTAGRPRASRDQVRRGSAERRLAPAAPTSTSTPGRAQALRSPCRRPAGPDRGGRRPRARRRRAISASAQGGVRPWCAQGSSVT